MIVDTHVYCFRAPDHPAGHATSADHLKFWQWGYAGHHNPSYSTRDRRPGNSTLLMDPAPGDPWRIADRNFRVDHDANRMLWTVDGEDFTKHYLPPQTVEWSAAACIGEMDYAGVDWALNHVDQALDRDNEFFAECVRAYPNRLKSMAIVDEPLIPTDPDRAFEGARHAIEDLGLHALKIIPEYAYRISGSKSFDEPSWRPFWDMATKLGVPIFFSLGAGRTAREVRQGFIDELWTVRRWSERYPDQQVSVTHGFPWRAFVEGDGFALTPQMWEPFKDSRIHLEVSMPIRIGDIFEYPWRETWPVHEAMVRNIGADRLMYGTDMPFQNRFCTYRQSHDFVSRHLPAVIGQDAVDRILGGTASAFLGDPPGAVAGPKAGTAEIDRRRRLMTGAGRRPVTPLSRRKAEIVSADAIRGGPRPVPMRIQTVLGPIDPASLGPTMMHEHTFFDIELAPGAYDAVVSDAELLASELALYGAAAGPGGTIVDLTTDTIGRNPPGMAEISRRSGVHIVMGAGWYRREYHPPSLAATWTNDLADALLREFSDGVPGSGGVKPGILGELGTGRGPAMTPAEERAFRAAGRAQRQVGFSISTHTTHFGELAFEQIELLREEGVPVERIVVGHVGELQGADDVLAIAETGVFVQVDHVGRKGGGMVDDRQRARNVAQLVRAGRATQVTLSMDICANSQMEARGGHGYAHLLRSFVPMLREEGVGDEAIRQMLVENPRRILAF